MPRPDEVSALLTATRASFRFQRAAINGHRTGAPLELPQIAGETTLTHFGLRLLLDAGRLVREQRSTLDRSDVALKADGSPATHIEEEIERRLREWVSDLDPEAVVVGEETGGELPRKGAAIAIDPIDGTYAFLSDSETYCTTLAVIRNGDVVLGMVSNPVTGEIAYANAGGGARLVRLTLFGEPDESIELRAAKIMEGPMLVDVHPSRTAAALMSELYRAWESREVDMVRSPGGSPSWSLVGAARGHFVYVNSWSKRPAEAYDLAAGTLIVREAGGDVFDPNGLPIDGLRHTGPFIAGLDRAKVAKLTTSIRSVLESR